MRCPHEKCSVSTTLAFERNLFSCLSEEAPVATYPTIKIGGFPMLGHGWPKKNFHEPPLLDNIVRKCYVSTCCAHEVAFFPVNVHLLGAHSGLGLAVCTSLGLLIGAYVFFFLICMLLLRNMQYCGAGDCPCCFAPQYALHWGLLIGAMCLYAFWILETCTGTLCGIGDSPCCFAPWYGYLYMFLYTMPMIYYIFAPFAP